MKSYQSGQKCGEIFVTNFGSFSWCCSICNEEFNSSTKFVSHICEVHIVSGECGLNAHNTKDKKSDSLHFEEMVETIDSKEILNEKSGYMDPLNLNKDSDILKLETEKLCYDSNSSIKEENNSDLLLYSDSEESLDSLSKDHEEMLMRKNKYNCEICSKSYNIERYFISHKKYHEKLKCHHCNEYFDDQKTFKAHDTTTCEQQMNLGIKTSQSPIMKKIEFKCKYCTRSFKKFISLEFHEELHENLPFKCTFCDKAFMKKSLLRDHSRTHTGERPYKCEHCPLAFTHIANFRRHESTHTGKKTCYCKFGCGKGFYMKRECVKHERTHTGEKSFVCELCGNNYATKYSLNIHKKSVHMDKESWKYKCNQCGRLFVAPKRLKEHMVVHTGEKRFKCEECGGLFSKASGLREHKKLHSGIRKHICKICGKSFAQTAGLYGHMKSHNVVKKTVISM